MPTKYILLSSLKDIRSKTFNSHMVCSGVSGGGGGGGALDANVKFKN